MNKTIFSTFRIQTTPDFPSARYNGTLVHMICETLPILYCTVDVASEISKFQKNLGYFKRSY
jgi:hypothetical protein